MYNKKMAIPIILMLVFMLAGCSGSGGSFDLTIPYTENEELFFATDSGADVWGDDGGFVDVRIQGVE